MLQAGRRLWKAPLVSQLFPFLWAEPHHADVSLFCDSRSWQNDHSTSRSRINCVGRSLSCRKGHGVQSPWLAVSQTYLSALFSCQRAVAKACCFHVKAGGRAGKRGLNKSCSAVTACYSSSISKAISNPKIILISASLISPFNSISTTI